METGIVIDGCYLPQGIYDQVKQTARAVGKTQFVGVHYNPPSTPQEPAPHDLNLLDAVTTLLSAPRYQKHLLVGAYCTYETYQAREDVPGDCAMVLWITPRAD